MIHKNNNYITAERVIDQQFNITEMFGQTLGHSSR